jgi:hypothetical protein
MKKELRIHQAALHQSLAEKKLQFARLNDKRRREDEQLLHLGDKF